ncbi:hypothetical protein HK105_204167 [Polyrhizophydium stewartii]|uniref:Guanylate cyclase n=1 Tax=Polyrhizophydium stewartii TaxID=2732419 RepID=A0ABR4NAD5_9FUNG
MSLPTLTASHVFGLNKDVRNNICYLDELSVVYPAGFQIVVFNLEQRSQRFVPVNVDGESLSTMAVLPSGPFVAAGIRVTPPTRAATESDKNATIVLYDLQTGRRRKTFGTGDAPSTKEFVSIAFTNDSKFLLAQGAAPDWCMYMWSLEKAKLVTWTKTSTNASTDINQMSCNHHDMSTTQVCVTGNGLFRVFRLVEGTFKMAHQNKMDKNIMCHSWVNETRVVAGTQDSKILIFDAGELVLEISYVIPHNSTGLIPSINTIMCFSSGLVVGLSTGVGVLFDKTDDSYYYKKSKEFLLEEAEISSIAMSPHEDSAVITMKNSQIYTITFEADTKGEEIKSDRLAQSFHTGTILSMDVSISKPLLVTSGTDKSVRVWNYMDNSIEVVKYFEEPAQCIAVHPNGLYLLAGFSTSVKLMAILIDDIRPFWDTNIRGCKECRFSNGGQYFAAIWGASVVIYDTWSFELLGHLKSTAGKIKSIAWSNDDAKIMTYTFDGSLTQWNMATLKKENEMAASGPTVVSAAMNHTSKLTYAIMNDGNIREVVNGAITREFVAKSPMSHVLISRSGQMMFVATTRGGIRSIKFPFGQDASVSGSDAIEYSFHSAPVTQLRTSFDDQFLFSCGDDGCVWVYRIQEKDGRAVRRDKDWTYSDEILVTKSDLRENYRTMHELKQRVEELKAESDAQLKIKDNAYNLKIKEVTDKYAAEVELLKQAKSEESELRRKEEMAETKKRNQAEIWEMEASFEAKMKSEAEKYADLVRKMEVLQRQWDTQMLDIEHMHKVKMHETNHFYKKKLQEKQETIQKSKAEFQQQKLEFETTIQDIEADVEKEALDISFHFETKLKEERESLKTIREENLNMKSKFDGLTKQIEEHKRELAKSITEEKKLHTIIRSFENDVVGVKKEMQERDDTILDKEKRIYDLKKKNQELEKFKFVLDYKIVELRKQVEPREKDIIKLTSQIEEMSTELREYSQRHEELVTDYLDMLMKHHATQRDRFVEEWRLKEVQSVLKRFERDLCHIFKHLDDMGVLKRQLTVLYHKYRDTPIDPPENPPPSEIPRLTNNELFILLDRIGKARQPALLQDAAEIPLSNDEEVESARKREYLEKTVSMLKEQLAKSETKRIDSTQKMVLENITLTGEVNALRTDMQGHRERLSDLHIAKKQGVSLRQFLQNELKTKTVKELLNPLSADDEDTDLLYETHTASEDQGRTAAAEQADPLPMQRLAATYFRESFAEKNSALFKTLRAECQRIENNYFEAEREVMRSANVAFLSARGETELMGLLAAQAAETKQMEEAFEKLVAARKERKDAKRVQRATMRQTKRRDLLIRRQEATSKEMLSIKLALSELLAGFNSLIAHMESTHEKERKQLIAAQERKMANEKMLNELETKHLPEELRSTLSKKFHVRQTHQAVLNKRINDQLRETQQTELRQAKERFELEVKCYDELGNLKTTHTIRLAELLDAQFVEMQAEKERLLIKHEEEKLQIIIQNNQQDMKRLQQQHRNAIRKLRIQQEQRIAACKQIKNDSTSSKYGSLNVGTAFSGRRMSIDDLMSEKSSHASSSQNRNYIAAAFSTSVGIGMATSNGVASGVDETNASDPAADMRLMRQTTLNALAAKQRQEKHSLIGTLQQEMNECQLSIDSRLSEIEEQHTHEMELLRQEQNREIELLISIQEKEIQMEQSVHDAEMKMLIERRILNSVLETVVDGIINITPTGIIVRFNAAAEKMFGYTAAEVMGKNIKMLMPERIAVNHDRYLSNYLSTGVKKVIGIGRRVSGLRKDGSEFPVQLSVSEVKENEEHLFTGIIRDLTEEVRLETEMRAKDAAKKAELENLIAQLNVYRKKADDLLSQMLPPSVSSQLLEGKQVEPQTFESATVFLLDIVGFTNYCVTAPPSEIIAMLDSMYNMFDLVIQQYDAYKVETIGDSYMIVSGVPKPNGKRHAGEIATLALHIMSKVYTFKFEQKPDLRLRVRIGIRTGPVVAGVVGCKMPRYCLFGDTVNTASRMESTSSPMKIQVSETTFRELSAVGGYHLVSRGEIEVKGKGKMNTYFLTGKEDFPYELPPQ